MSTPRPTAAPAPAPAGYVDLLLSMAAQTDDGLEEDAEAFLADHGHPITSHSCTFLITEAVRRGWRPLPIAD